jgi:AraC-like DNA-binding protein
VSVPELSIWACSASALLVSASPPLAAAGARSRQSTDLPLERRLEKGGRRLEDARRPEKVLSDAVLRADDKGSLTVLDNLDCIPVENAVALTQQQKTGERSKEIGPLEGGSSEADGFIAVIESRSFVRECLRRSLQSAFPLSVLTYSTAIELEQQHLLTSPKLIIFSWVEDNKEASTNALKVLSELAPRIPVIVLAYNNDAELARTAICHGAKGYIPVTMGFEIAIEAVRFVLAGETYVPMDWLLARGWPGDAPSQRPPTSGLNAAVAGRLLTSDPKLLKALEPFCDMAAKERRPASNMLCAAVKKEVEKLLPHGKAQKKTVARALGMSTRTFSRRLAVEETTYEEVVDQLRRSLALRYLKDPGMSLSQISWLLGYECSSSFSHAFRRWTGSSPSLARRGSRFLRLQKA